MNDVSAQEVTVREESPTLSMLGLIARAASDPNVNVEKMQALLAMQKELIADQAKAQFNEAFARLLPRLPRVTKRGEVKYPEDKNNPRSPLKKAFSYAKWEDIDEAIRPLLIEEGFSLAFDTMPQAGGGVIVTGTLMHGGGHSRTASIGPLPLDTSGGKNNLQGAGSTFSYGKRYTSTMLLNLTFEGEDDDGVRGGMDSITDEEASELSRGLTETSSNLTAFLAFMGVAAIPDIQKKDLTRARNMIQQKRERQKK